MSKYKSFAELGLAFNEGSGCYTCRDLSCHNTVQSTINGREYNVHISMNEAKTEFKVHATEDTSVSSPSEIEADFYNELDAVGFVCLNFEWFKCF